MCELRGLHGLKEEYDLVIVGAGLSGSVVAEQVHVVFFYCILSAILFFDFFEIPQVSSQDLSVILLFEFFSIFKCHRLAPRL